MMKEKFVEHYTVLSNQDNRGSAFGVFMDKMAVAEKFVHENGYYSEEELEKELDKI